MILLRFSAGQGATGAVIRAATWSWADHVGFKISPTHVLDALPQYGVSVRVPTDDDGRTEYYRVLAPDSVLQAAVDYAYTQIGKPYDWSGVFGIGVHRDWHCDGKWFCSELVAGALAKVGFHLLRTDHLNRITPGHILMSPLIAPATSQEIAV